MLDLFLLFSFLGTTLAQFRTPILTIAPSSTVPIFTVPYLPLRTIGSTIENVTSTISTTSPLSTTLTLPTSTTVSNTFTQTNETEEINQNLFFIIIPSGLLLLFLFIHV